MSRRKRKKRPPAKIAAPRGESAESAAKRSSPATWGPAPGLTLPENSAIWQFWGPATTFGARVYIYTATEQDYAAAWEKPTGNDPIRRMFDNHTLSADQVRASIAIASAVRLIAPHGWRTMATTRGRDGSAEYSVGTSRGRPMGGDTGEDRELDCLLDYYVWRAAMIRNNVATFPVIDVVFEGLTCETVDRRRQWRNGSTSSLICKALNLWIKTARRRRRYEGRPRETMAREC